MKYFFSLIIVALILSCNSTYTSKKEGYYKIDFPERAYTTFNDPTYPYTFEYPVYARVDKDSSYFDSLSKNPFWINIDFPSFNGKIFISYKNIGGTSVYKVKIPGGGYSSPRSRARRTAARRSATSSLVKMCFVWVRKVL